MKLWIIVGSCVLLAVFIIAALACSYYDLALHKAKMKWNDKHEEQKKKDEEKKKKKQAEKYCKVNLKNPYLEELTKQYNIIVYGHLGAGKTLIANLLCHYLSKKYSKEDKRNRRYNHYMLPEYEADLQKLKKNKLLRVYSNIPLKDCENNSSQNLWPYLTQQKRFVERGIMFTDEFGTNLGKDLYFSQDKNSIEVERIVEMSRYARQNCDIKWIGTEQSCDNIFKPIRDRGFCEIEALKTFVGVSKWGKFKRGLVNFVRLILPGFLTLNLKKVFEKKLFKRDIFLTTLKLLLPSYFLLPREFYIKKTITAAKIKKKHTRYATLINFYGKQMFFKFSNKDIFAYNTRQNRANYLKQFDKEGNRIV